MEEHLTLFRFKEYWKGHHMPGTIGAAGDEVIRELPNPTGHSRKRKQT